MSRLEMTWQVEVDMSRSLRETFDRIWDSISPDVDKLAERWVPDPTTLQITPGESLMGTIQYAQVRLEVLSRSRRGGREEPTTHGGDR